MALTPIRYRDFYDMPRAFIVERSGSIYFFDCPFDEQIDAYPDRYRVYRFDSALSQSLGTDSWLALASRGKLAGEILAERIQFDPTRRAAVDDLVFELIRS